MSAIKSEGCPHCRRKGLPLLLTRPGVVALDARFAPPGADRLQTHEGMVQSLGLPDLRKNRYVMRLLRTGGFVYIYYPTPTCFGWQTYQVLDDGVLLPVFRVPQSNPSFTCSRYALHVHDVRTICIEDVDQMDSIWVGFSANWWTNVLKDRAKNDPAAMGMVEVKFKQARQACGFAATEADVSRYVAEYTIPMFKHSGMGSELNTYDYTEEKFAQNVRFSDAPRILLDAMRRQLGDDGENELKPQVVAIPDMVGLAHDLNIVRQARGQWINALWAENPQESHRLFSSNTILAMKTALQDSIEEEILNNYAPIMSQAVYEKNYKGTVLEQEGNSAWYPFPQGHPKAVDEHGMCYGRWAEIELNHKRLGQHHRLLKHSRQDAQSQWERLVRNERAESIGWLDEDAMMQWRETFRQKYIPYFQELELFEWDWLDAATHELLDRYFDRHFDEDDPAEETAIVSSGELYAQESVLSRYVENLSSLELQQAFLDRLMPDDLSGGDASLIRAMAGNHRPTIERLHDLLQAPAGTHHENGIDVSMQDKVYSVLSGLSEATYKPNWLKPIVAGYWGGIMGSLTYAAGHRLTEGGLFAPQVQKLLRLFVTQQGLLKMMQLGVGKPVANLPVLLQIQVPPSEALKLMWGEPTYSRSDRHAMTRQAAKKGARPVTLLVLTDMDKVEDVLGGKLAGVAAAPGAGANSKAGQSYRQLQARAAQINAVISRGAPEDLRHLYRNTAPTALKQELGRLSKAGRILTSIDGQIAVGMVLVQGIGLINGAKALYELPDEALGPQERRAYEQQKLLLQLGVVDNLTGVAAGFAASQKVLAEGIEAAVRNAAVSAKDWAARAPRVAGWAAGIAFLGALSGAVSAFMSLKQADFAAEKGDVEASNKNWWAFGSFFGNTFFHTGAGLLYFANAVYLRRQKNTVLYGAARGVVRMFKGPAGVAGAAMIFNRIGQILFLMAIGFSVWAALSTPSELQRWIARTPFGTGSQPRYKDFEEEAEELRKLIALDMATETGD